VQAQRHIHSLCAERAVGAARHRRPVCQRLVRTLVIVKSQPFGGFSIDGRVYSGEAKIAEIFLR
jgi:hypothetical protein